MAGWSGFTDDDLRKMRQNTEKDGVEKSFSGQRRSERKQHPAKMQAKGRAAKTASLTERESIVDKQNSLKNAESHLTEKTETKIGTGESKSHADPSQHLSEGTIENASKESSVVDKPEVKELDESEALHLELDNVQKFQQRQKMIEEANKQKRALLAKAIEDRRKKAKAEAEKLMRVQQELNHLDSLLTADVNIIRDKIEIASLEYMDAQKRYEKAEKEFIAAKMELFAKGETKEHLTEHLYTIIHQNEVRKAKKLVELMEKLAMEVTPEEMELTIPAIPQLTNFTAVATIHDPHYIKNSPTCEKTKDPLSPEALAQGANPKDTQSQVTPSDTVQVPGNSNAENAPSKPSSSITEGDKVSSAAEQQNGAEPPQSKDGSEKDTSVASVTVQNSDSGTISAENVHNHIPGKNEEVQTKQKASCEETISSSSDTRPKLTEIANNHSNDKETNAEDKDNATRRDETMLSINNSPGWTLPFA